MDKQQTESNGIWQELKDKSLKAAGYAYLVGDAALFASGWMSGRKKEAMTGLGWGLGGLACAKYGSPSDDKKLELLTNKLRDHLVAKGVKIPDDPTINQLTGKDGLLGHVEEFMYAHPSEMLNGVYAAFSMPLLMSGVENKKKWDTTSGALIMAGGLSGLLIKEKKPDPDNPPRTAFEKAKAWIQEKPLRASGTLYGLNNISLILSAMDEYQKNPAQKSYVFKFLTAASYIFANTMLSLSSKDNLSTDSTALTQKERENQHKLMQAAAHIIAAQPKPLQEALLQDIAHFLAEQPENKLSAATLIKHMKVELTRHAGPESVWQSRTQSSPEQNSQPTL